MRREFWEHKIAIFWVPAASAIMSAIFIVWLITATNSTAGIVDQLNQLSAMSAAEAGEQLISAYGLIAFSIISPLLITVPIYLLVCLYDDRKNNSSLFWYSMPVSNTKTVSSKLLTALVLMPLMAFLILATLFGFLLLLLAVMAATGSIDVQIIWTVFSTLLQWLPWLLFSMLVVGLWLLPLYGWLLFVSAFARAVPFFWAIGVVLVLVLIESVLFSSSYLSTWIGSRNIPFERLSASGFDLIVAFLDYEMLHGLVIGGLFIFGAVNMRRFAD
jgi:ABC-2 type transport system permease protein